MRTFEEFKKQKVGPNCKRLITMKMATDAIPANGGLLDGVHFLRSPKAIRSGAENAIRFLYDSLEAVKASHDNPYGDDDEAIAGAVLAQIEERKCLTS